MKKYFLILLALSFYLSGFCQQNLHSYKINWHKASERNNQYIFHFNQASFDDDKTLLPSYTTLLNLDGNRINLTLKVEKTLVITDQKAINYLNRISTFLSNNFTLKQQSTISAGKNKISVSVFPFRKNIQTGQYEKIISFSLLSNSKTSQKNNDFSLKNYKSNSILASGDWYKLKITKSGVYKLSYENLKEIGINNPLNIRIFGNGGYMLPLANNDYAPDDLLEINYAIDKGSDNTFNSGDYIYFYAQSALTYYYDTIRKIYRQESHLYSKENYYFITPDLGTGKIINNAPSITQTPDILYNTYTDIHFHEREDTNLIRSGRVWFGEQFFSNTSNEFDFEIPNRKADSSIKIFTHVTASSSSAYPNNIFNYKVNGILNVFNLSIPGVTSNSYTFGNEAFGQDEITSNTKNINVHINFLGGSSTAKGWLDYIILNTSCMLSYSDNQINFRNITENYSNNIIQYTLSNATDAIIIWDITHHNQVQKINTTITSNNAQFKVFNDTLREFIAFTKNNLLSIENINEVTTKISNQNLHALAPVDYIIITHPDFKSYAQQIAALHKEQDDLDFAIIEPEFIYNEFSSGKPDVTAYRNFVRMMYNKALTSGNKLKYLLLFGDGSYNNINNFEGNTNYLLTFQSSNSLSETTSFSSDDYFGLLDNDEGGGIDGFDLKGSLDIGIGRIPSRNSKEAEIVVRKIQNYANNIDAGDWQNMLCFIADDADDNQTLHMRDSDYLTKRIQTYHPNYNFDKIYLDAYPQESTPSGERYPDVTIAINNRMNKGALILNYTGHGNPKIIAHEQVLKISDVQSWKNGNKLPLILTGSCEISRFDDWQRTSIGEHMLFAEQGGGIALLSTTRVVYSGSNYQLNYQFYEYAFNQGENGEIFTFGDIVRLTKNNTGEITSRNKRNFTLFGDPALKFPLPKMSIYPTSINSINIQNYNDTLKALTKATITGYIGDTLGNINPSINGIMYPTIYDKKNKITTLSNDGYESFQFTKQNNILYRGKVSIRNGEFTFSFIIPKDIAYNIDYGKISFYSITNNIIASGCYNKVLIGGSSNETITDNDGPELELYINDSNFVSGGITNASPKIVAYVHDEFGINTVGNGIGHDIIAIIDNDEGNSLNLNDFYESDIDSYKSGKIEYPLDNLSKGEHHLRLKVWDIFNNSSESEITFYVQESENLVLDHVFNYPNPFTTATDFHFDHNQPNTQIEILIHVFTISGKLVKTLNSTYFSEGFHYSGLHWDGLDDYGDRLGRGVYIYLLKVKTADGKTSSKYEKLVLLK